MWLKEFHIPELACRNRTGMANRLRLWKAQATQSLSE